MSVFGWTLDQTCRERGHNQGMVAEYINDWMRTHNLDAELAHIERTATAADRALLADVFAVIEDYRARKPKLAKRWQTSQAAVSKWVHGGQPSPEKWLALARYMEIPLWELYDMISNDYVPQTAPALRQRLDAVTAELEDAHEKIDVLDEMLRRAEDRLREGQSAEARLLRRITMLESMLAEQSESIDGVRV